MAASGALGRALLSASGGSAVRLKEKDPVLVCETLGNAVWRAWDVADIMIEYMCVRDAETRTL